MFMKSTRRASPELHFITFEENGTGWLAEVEGRELRLRVVRRGSEVARTSLGRSRGVDFVQDIKPVRPGQVVLALIVLVVVIQIARSYRVRKRPGEDVKRET